MNGRGGYCIARYGGGGGGMYTISKVDSIMLKFRPIVPKPVAPGSGLAENNNQYVNCGRSKRKYVRVNKIKKKNDNCNKKLKVKVPVSPSISPPVVTLPLLPETPDRKENKPVNGFSDLLSLSPTPSVQKIKSSYDNKKATSVAPAWLNFHAGTIKHLTPPVMQQVVSKVTVECVTDTWVDMEGLRLGCTDEERVIALEKDTCPGFISDGQDRVLWTNKAYRQMAKGEDMVVVLIWKDKWAAPAVTDSGFTCKVRVTVTAGADDGDRLSPRGSTMTVPCDVWRMQRGGYAWRLDVKAALSLGR